MASRKKKRSIPSGWKKSLDGVRRVVDPSENVTPTTRFWDSMGSSWDFDNIEASNSQKRNIEALTGIVHEDETDNPSYFETEWSEWHFPMGRPLGVWPSKAESRGVEKPLENALGWWCSSSCCFSCLGRSTISISFTTTTIVCRLKCRIWRCWSSSL